MKKVLFILFILLSTSLLNAQLVQVSGYVFQRGDSSVSIPHAALINKRTHSGNQSTVDGFYTMLMAPGDTMEVSLIGYKTSRVALPADYVGNSYHVNVYLKEDAIHLSGYTKYSITWARFKQAFESIKPEEEVTYLTLDNKSLRPVDKPNTGVTLNGPISWVFDKLSRKAKEQDKLNELREGRDYDMESTRRISDEYVMNIIQLDKKYVNDFLQYCQSDAAFYSNATDYDIKAKFLSCLPGFKTHAGIIDNNTNSAPADSLNPSPR